VAIYSLRGRGYELITATGSTPVFMPEGKRILYIDRDGLRIVDRASKISRLVLPVPASDFIGYAASRDRRSLYLVINQTEGDIWSATWK